MYRTISLYLNSRIIDLREKHCRTVPVYNNLPFIVARSLFGLRVVSALTHPISINYVHKLCKSMQVTCHSIKHFHEQGTQVDPVTIMSLTLTWVSLLILSDTSENQTRIYGHITFSISITTDVKALSLPIFISSTFQIQWVEWPDMTGSRTGKVEITQLPETLNNIMIVQLTILHHHISCLWHLSHYCNNWCGHRPLSTSPEFLLTFPPDSFAALSLPSS